MPSLDKEENKRNISDLELLLLIEMGFFSNLKKAKLKFNLRPSSEPKHLQVEPIDWNFDTGFLDRLKQMKIRFNARPTSEPSSNDTVKTSSENIVDLHLEIARKVDELIADRERELQEEVEPITQMQQPLPLQEFVEFREVTARKPEISQLSSEVQPGNVFREVVQEEEFFEIVPPTETQSIEQDQQVNDDFQSTMIREVQKSHKLFMGASHVQIKTKSTPKKAITTGKPQKKLNAFTKKQIELEKSKQEIEAREIALKEAKEKEKTKEEELKKAREEELEREKLKKLEQKKRKQKKKLEERELKKAEKLRQIELKKLEKVKLLKLKEKERETQKVERLKQIEFNKIEKEKLEEEKQKEKEKLERLKEKERETQKVERLKQIEFNKIEKEKLLKDKQKEKEKLERLKQKDEEEAKKQKERELIEQEKEKLEEQKKKEKLMHKEAEKIKAKKPKKEKFTLFSKKKPKKKKTEEKPKEQPVEEIKEVIIEKPTKDEKTFLDNDVEKLLPILDDLLENLPEDVIDEFAHSAKFTLYEKVMRKYQNK